MSKVTPKLGLVLPGGGSTGLNMPPDRVDIDVVNDNFTKIDTDAGARADQVAALAARLGMVIVKPTSVVGLGVTVDADGRVNLGTQEPGGVTVNGVFTTDFRQYLIICDYSVDGGVNGSLFRFTNAGVVDASQLYWTQTAASIGPNASNDFSLSDRIAGVPVSSLHHSYEMLVLTPAQASLITRYKLEAWSNGGSGGIAVRAGAFEAAKAFDGFRLELSSVASGRKFSGGQLTVYGIR